MVIKIIKIPEGPESEWVRKEWVGMCLDICSHPFRDGIFVNASQVLMILEKNQQR